MNAVTWLLAAGLFLCAIAGFLLGRAAGRRAGEAVAADNRLEAERALGAERATTAQYAEQARSLQRELERERESRAAELLTARAALEQREQQQLAAVEKLRQQLSESERVRIRLETELRTEQAAGLERLEAARRAEQERQAFVVAAQADMSARFEKLAAGILEDKSKRFTDHNRTSIEQLLHPLREKLGEFQLKVEGLQQDGVIGRTELKTQIEALRGMNEKLSTDANNLVMALKGSSKQQGDWGEILLIGMLEDAGLRAGHEYRVQASFATEEGRHARPDIILNLPDDKHLVIDSKVSLTSYAEYCACDDEAARAPHLERHARSLASHIDGLSKKGYQTLHQLRSLDFVLMFVPIEPAYLLALAHDGNLWQRAWKKEVLLVSPGTLFPVIRTIAHIWQQERQTKNVEKILLQAGGLYDKVAAFASSFEDVGKKLDGAQTAYDKAYGQLASGKGHVLSRIENLRKLGVRATKAMPRTYSGIDEAEEAESPGEAEAESLPLLLEDAASQD